MRRAMVAAISCLSFGLLYSDGPDRIEPREDSLPLPHVGAAPDRWAETDAVSGQAEPNPRLDDPEVQALLSQLELRHTGLSREEIHELARTVVGESRRQELEPDLVFAVMQVESSCYNFAVSSVGALGLMQIMPRTGESLARKLNVDWRGPDTLFDPIVNVRLGIAYLKILSDRYGSLPTALAAYNWGPARIDSRLRRGAALPSKYVQQVLRVFDPPGSRLARRS